jgi:isopentenyl-diphosphate delta-isomerase
MAANPKEVMDLRWVEYHDLLAEVQRWPSRFTPWLRIYLDQHSDRIFSPDMVRAMA